MYDNVTMFLPWMRGDNYSTLANVLTEPQERRCLKTGTFAIVGKLDGLRVFASDGGVWVNGSLCKYFNNGSNVYQLDRHTTAEAITKLSDALKLDFMAARVSKLEFGANFVMLHPASEYIKALGLMPRLQRFKYGDTVYYRHRGKQKPKELVFYDKIADANAKGMPTPAGFAGLNVLRYEMRVNSIKSVTKWAAVEGATLSDADFYRRLAKIWSNYYFLIKKQPQMKIDVSKIATPRDAIELFLARQLAGDGQEKAAAFIDELKAAGTFSDPKYYTRLKQMFAGVASKAGEVSNDLVNEFDDAVKNAVAHL